MSTVFGPVTFDARGDAGGMIYEMNVCGAAITKIQLRASGRKRQPPPQIDGRGGLDSARYGDWEVKGRAISNGRSSWTSGRAAMGYAASRIFLAPFAVVAAKRVGTSAHVLGI